MQRYELPDHQEISPSFWRRHGWWLIPIIVIDVVAVSWWLLRRGKVDAENERPAIHAASNMAPSTHVDHEPAAPPPAEPPGLVFGFPTPQQQLLMTNSEGIYMPTASGRLESALYGTVRTSQQGKHLLPSFHEGLDIAPTGRDRRQMPTDPILAVANGRVAYVNHIAGNSNYGKYIVLLHDDPLGEIYTLYAHMADIAPEMRPGRIVTRGDRLGLMGNSASSAIPVARAHLHFEIGIVNNLRFQQWYRAQKLKPDHGNFHGHNLTGINPLDVFSAQERQGSFSMLSYLRNLPPAFEVVFRAPRIPDYFVRYPALWGGGRTGGVLTMTVSEGGVPLSARMASESEKSALGNRDHHILRADENVLGRNGLRLVVKRQEQWVLGRNGERWLEILTYH